MGRRDGRSATPGGGRAWYLRRARAVLPGRGAADGDREGECCFFVFLGGVPRGVPAVFDRCQKQGRENIIVCVCVCV